MRHYNTVHGKKKYFEGNDPKAVKDGQDNGNKNENRLKMMQSYEKEAREKMLQNARGKNASMKTGAPKDSKASRPQGQLAQKGENKPKKDVKALTKAAKSNSQKPLVEKRRGRPPKKSEEEPEQKSEPVTLKKCARCGDRLVALLVQNLITRGLLPWFGCVGPGFRDPVMRYPIFQGFSPSTQRGFNFLLPIIWNSRLLGLREGSYSQLNPNTTPAVI